MRKFISVVLSLLMSLAASWSIARPISETTARTVAQRWLAQQGINMTPEGLQVDSLAASGKAALYVYQTPAPLLAWAVVAGDDVAEPILGYSTDSPFIYDTRHANIKKWIDGYVKQIRWAQSQGLLPNGETQSLWRMALGLDSKPSNGRPMDVQPLLSTRWDQDPYYNALCPFDAAAGERTVVGCVATAMAQVMKFHNWPTRGSGIKSYNTARYGTLTANFGATTYNWAAMPNVVAAPNPAVATLSYHCGVATEMVYDIGSRGGSGTYVTISSFSPQNNAEYALKTFFGYVSTLRGVQRSSYSATQWQNLAKAELDARRPILYSGAGSGGGHAWVCDGYDANNRFHMNWGWSGNSDGYFALSALNPAALGTGGGDGGFNTDQEMVIGVQPPSGGNPTGSPVLTLSRGIILSPTSISYADPFSLTANVANTGTGAFSGQILAALFSNGNFVAGIDTLTTGQLGTGMTFASPLSFSTQGVLAAASGTYQVQLFYRTNPANQWTAITDGVGMPNLATLTVTNVSAFRLRTAIVVTGGGAVAQGQSLTGNFSVENASATSFSGVVSLDLYDLNGNYLQTIQEYPNSSLPAGTFSNPINYSSAAITAAPGSYILALTYQPTGSTNWLLVGDGAYRNPVFINVVEPTIQPDSYEPNDEITQANLLPYSAFGTGFKASTPGSNLHVGNDVDHYKLSLPTGFSYTFNPRLQDSYSADNGQNYTVDAIFSYSLDNGVSWSETVDDVMAGPFVLGNGGLVIFKVANYTPGNTGTYLLDIPFTRGPVSVSEKSNNKPLILYPNPAKDCIYFDNENAQAGQVYIIDLQGKTLAIQSLVIGKNSLNTSSLAAGTYMVKLQIGSATRTGKITVAR